MAPSTLDSLISSAASGDALAHDQLFRMLYSELRRIVERELRRAGAASMLSPTTVLHEICLAIAGRQGQAAVKLLNASLIGGPVEQRFVREGSVLASLRHPNIAQLIDAGVAACGQPCLVIEHVEGNAIDAY